MKRFCVCGRPATFFNVDWKKRMADKDHDLCRRCYIASVNRSRPVKEKR